MIVRFGFLTICCSLSLSSMNAQPQRTQGPVGADVLGIDYVSHDTSGTVLLAHTPGQMFLSSDSGKNWGALPAFGQVTAMATMVDEEGRGVIFRSIYAFEIDIEYRAVQRSTDFGATWTNMATSGLITSDFTMLKGSLGPDGRSLVFLGTSGFSLRSLYRSSDAGQTWMGADSGLGSLTVYDLVALQSGIDTVMALATDRGIFRSIDFGTSWKLVRPVLGDDVRCRSVDAMGSNVLVIASNDSTYRSTDAGISWSSSATPASGARRVRAIGDRFFLATDSGLYSSLAGETSWVLTQLPDPEVPVWDIRSTPVGIALACLGDGVMLSPDGGSSWSPRNNGLPGAWVNVLLPPSAGVGSVLAGTSWNGLYAFEPGSATWRPTALRGVGIEAVTQFVHDLPLSQKKTFIATDEGVMFATTSGWERTALRAPARSIGARPSPGGEAPSVILAGLRVMNPPWSWYGTSSWLVRSSDLGASWDTLLSGSFPVSIVSVGGYFVAQWSPDVCNCGGEAAESPTTQRRTTWLTGLRRSSDDGMTWEIVLPDSIYASGLTVIRDGSNLPVLLAGTSHGLYMSRDSGATWSMSPGMIGLPVGMDDHHISAIGVTEPESGVPMIVAAVQSAGVYVSNDLGEHWSKVAFGEANVLAVNALLIHDGWLYVSTASDGIWRMPVTDLQTGSVQSSGLLVPVEDALEQNFPNPFNPTTNITYALAQPSHVRLSIFDLLGREVDVLIDGDVPAGSHQFTWNAGERPSGVYFARLTANGRHRVRKLLLTR